MVPDRLKKLETFQIVVYSPPRFTANLEPNTWGGYKDFWSEYYDFLDKTKDTPPNDPPPSKELMAETFSRIEDEYAKAFNFPKEAMENVLLEDMAAFFRVKESE